MKIPRVLAHMVRMSIVVQKSSGSVCLSICPSVRPLTREQRLSNTLLKGSITNPGVCLQSFTKETQNRLIKFFWSPGSRSCIVLELLHPFFYSTSPRVTGRWPWTPGKSMNSFCISFGEECIISRQTNAPRIYRSICFMIYSCTNNKKTETFERNQQMIPSKWFSVCSTLAATIYRKSILQPK